MSNKSIEEFLDIADQAYHDGDNPIMSDAAYDSLRKQVPERMNVGAPAISGGFVKSRHVERLRSLDNVFNADELLSWCNSLQPVSCFSIEYKLDGLALCLTYENRQLVTAATRGDGDVGDDVTVHAKHIANIPLTLPNNFPVEQFTITGEVQMLKSTLKAINEQLTELGQKNLANTRNAAAGAIRNHNPEIVASRELVFTPYGFGDRLVQLTGYTTYNEVMSLIETVFDTSMVYRQLATTDEGIAEAYARAIENRNNLNYDIDGLVFKVNSLEDRERIGTTTRAPGWAIAAKFPPEEVITTLKSFEYAVGRTGVITPVAILEPVYIGGVVVGKCTLHNFDEIERLNIGRESLVSVERRGDVIPKIVLGLTPGHQRTPITECPCCRTALVKENVLVFCPNKVCFDRLVAQLTYFASRDVMDIKGMGPEICEIIVKKGLALDPFNLFNKGLEWGVLEDAIGKLTTDKIRQSLNEKSTMTLDRFILALGMDLIGPSVAKIIADHYGSLELLYDDLRSMAFNNNHKSKLADIDGIGERILDSFFGTLVERLNFLLGIIAGDAGFTVTPMPTKTNELEGSTFVITGSFKNITRDEIKSKLISKGAKVSGSVSKKTNALICGENAGSKLDDATRLNIPVYAEEDLARLIA